MRKIKFKKLVIFTVLLLALFVIFLYFQEQKSVLVKESAPEKGFEILKEDYESEIVIMAVGDIMLERGVEYMIEKHGKGDFKSPFLMVSDYLDKADILFGNLESVISNKGEKVGSIYSFRAKPEAIEGLVFPGFDILSIANNHSFDYGREALEDCLKRLKEAGIDYVGAGFNKEEVRRGVLKEIKGTKIAFLAYTNKGLENWQAGENYAGIGWLDENIKEDIKKIKEKSDIIFVSMHFGEEYQKEPNEEQEYFARMAIDSGADFVIGHHPHVVQPVEKYNQGWIAYSLGNFIFDQYFSEETIKGMLLEIIVENKKIKEVKQREVKISALYQPFFDF